MKWMCSCSFSRIWRQFRTISITTCGKWLACIHQRLAFTIFAPGCVHSNAATNEIHVVLMQIPLAMLANDSSAGFTDLIGRELLVRLTSAALSHFVPVSGAVRTYSCTECLCKRWLYIVGSCDSGPFLTSCKWLMHTELMNTLPVPC